MLVCEPAVYIEPMDTGLPSWLGPLRLRLMTVAAALFFLLPTLAFPFGWDQGMLHYLGWAVSRGEWLYRDVWDTASPGGVWLDATAIKLFGNHVIGVRMLDYAWQAATCWALFRCGAKISGPLAGCYAAISYAIAYRATGFYHTAQRDSFLVLPLLGSMLAGWQFAREARRRDLAASGVLLGLTVLIRPTYVLVPVVFAIWLLSRSRREQSFTARLKDAAWLAIFSALPVVGTIVLFLAAGCSSALRDLILAITTVYPRLERFTVPELLSAAVGVVPTLAWMGLGA